MPTDYDAPRVKETDDVAEESPGRAGHAPAHRMPTPRSSTSTTGTPPTRSSSPDADLSGEELTVRVVPKQADEFTLLELLFGAAPPTAGAARRAINCSAPTACDARPGRHRDRPHRRYSSVFELRRHSEILRLTESAALVAACPTRR